jgi:hypothetical protein
MKFLINNLLVTRKYKEMKKIFLLCLIILQVSCLFAQNNNNSTFREIQAKLYAEQKQQDSIMRENTLNNAEFVFEGVIKYYSSNYDTIDRNINGVGYYIVDIKKVFKGNIAPVIVKIIFKMEDDEAASSGVPYRDTVAIFFCKGKSELKNYLPKESDKYSNLLTLGGYNELSSKGWSMIQMEPPFWGFDKEFKNKTTAYDFLRKYPGLNIPVYKEPSFVIPPCTNCITKEQYDSLGREFDKQVKERAKKK